MGHVQDFIECPRCKSDNCVINYLYKTGEEYSWCSDCGYRRNLTLKRDENGNIIFKDKSKGLVEGNVLIELKVSEEPFAHGMIEYMDGCGVGKTLESKNDYNEYVSYIENTCKNDDDIKEVIVSRFVNGKIIKEVIFQHAT